MTECIYCKGCSVKNGLRNKIQTYKCKECKKCFRLSYLRKPRIYNDLITKLVPLHKEGVGIRGIGRLLKTSPQTVMRFMVRRYTEILLKKKRDYAYGDVWEIDEMRTFYKNKTQECWITYILNHKTKEVFGFVVGSRSKVVMAPLLNNLFEYNPAKIHSDKLPIYKYLIPLKIHRTVARCTNYIERNNLTLRNHIKRLNRKTLSFSKSINMLSVSLGLYFFG